MAQYNVNFARFDHTKKAFLEVINAMPFTFWGIDLQMQIDVPTTQTVVHAAPE